MIYLHIPTVFWAGGRHFSRSLNVHGVNDDRQTEILSVESLVPDSSAVRG